MLFKRIFAFNARSADCPSRTHDHSANAWIASVNGGMPLLSSGQSDEFALERHAGHQKSRVTRKLCFAGGFFLLEKAMDIDHGVRAKVMGARLELQQSGQECAVARLHIGLAEAVSLLVGYTFAVIVLNGWMRRLTEIEFDRAIELSPSYSPR